MTTVKKGMSVEELSSIISETTILTPIDRALHIMLSPSGGRWDDIVGYINADPHEIDRVGLFEIKPRGGALSSRIYFIEDWFKDPLKPTEAELMLYELEFNHVYLLLDYLKPYK